MDGNQTTIDGCVFGNEMSSTEIKFLRSEILIAIQREFVNFLPLLHEQFFFYSYVLCIGFNNFLFLNFSVQYMQHYSKNIYILIPNTTLGRLKPMIKFCYKIV